MNLLEVSFLLLIVKVPFREVFKQTYTLALDRQARSKKGFPSGFLRDFLEIPKRDSLGIPKQGFPSESQKHPYRSPWHLLRDSTKGFLRIPKRESLRNPKDP